MTQYEETRTNYEKLELIKTDTDKALNSANIRKQRAEKKNDVFEKKTAELE